VECKLRYVNFRRVSDPRRAFWPAFRVTGISDDRYRSTMGVIVICLGTPGSIWKRRRQVWKHQQQAWEHLGVPVTSLGAPPITVEQSRITSAFGTLLVCLDIIATTYRSTICKTHVFSLYSDLCIYIATHLHTVYLDWLHAVLESNSRCT